MKSLVTDSLLFFIHYNRVIPLKYLCPLVESSWLAVLYILIHTLSAKLILSSSFIVLMCASVSTQTPISFFPKRIIVKNLVFVSYMSVFVTCRFTDMYVRWYLLSGDIYFIGFWEFCGVFSSIQNNISYFPNECTIPNKSWNVFAPDTLESLSINNAVL